MTYATVMASKFGKCVLILRTDPLTLTGQSSQSQICATLLKIYVHKGCLHVIENQRNYFVHKNYKNMCLLGKTNTKLRFN